MAEYVPLVGKQLASVELATAAGNLWEGSVRSSKTVCSIMKWLDFVINGPSGPLLMVGKTERTLKRNVLDVIVGMVGSHRCRISTGSGEVKILGRTIYIAGANDERAAEKIQGMTLAGLYGDEISTWPESVFSIARTRLSVPGAQWFGTTNPGSTTHFLKVNFIDKASLRLTHAGNVERFYGDDLHDLHVFSFGIHDNPSLDPDFVRRLEREYTGVFRKRYILGEWCMAEGAIFDAWDEERNTMPRALMPEMTAWLAAGIDYGTRNPFHACMLALGPDERAGGMALYITDEWRWDSARRRGQLGDDEYADRTLAWMRNIEHPSAPNLRGVSPEMIAVDPSAASFRVKLYKMGHPTRMADNEVGDSIRVAASLIANRKIVVASECEELIKEIPSYAWDEKAAKLGEEKPVKAADHGIDAGLRYAPFTSRQLWHDEIYPDVLDTPLTFQ